MKGLLHLAIKSLWNRRLTTLLTVLSISLSVGLFLGVERVRRGARESFSNTLSQTDLIVGARGSPLQLLLYTVFHMGDATQNISIESYQHFKNHPATAWTIPISLGDNHKGYRVVATDENFYKEYRFHLDQSLEMQEGARSVDIFDVVVGSEVASSLKYSLGSPLVLTHGISEGFYTHEDKPFKVVGILKRTGTPLDRSLYITLEGMEAIHVDWVNGAPSPVDKDRSDKARPSNLSKEDLQPKQITSFLLRTKNRVATLRLGREIDTYEAEPLMATIPGVALAKLWESLGYAEEALRIVSLFVIFVGFVGMLLSLYTTLEERRREMAILRALGASPAKILSLFFLESFLIILSGILLGVGLVYLLLAVGQPWIQKEFGLFLSIQVLSSEELIYLAGIFGAGCIFGLLPAWRAYRNSLADGLMLRL